MLSGFDDHVRIKLIFITVSAKPHTWQCGQVVNMSNLLTPLSSSLTPWVQTLSQGQAIVSLSKKLYAVLLLSTGWFRS